MVPITCCPLVFFAHLPILDKPRLQIMWHGRKTPFFPEFIRQVFFWTDPWWNMEKNIRAKSHTKSYLPPTATTQSQALCWFPIKGNYRWIEEKNFRSNREFKLHWLIQLPFELILGIIYLSKSIYKLVVFTVRKHFPIQTLHNG